MKFLASLLFVFTIAAATAQKNLPVLRATSDSVVILANGKSVYGPGGFWRITPSARPDIYYSENPGEVITFITNLDSIRVKIDESTEFNFVVMLKKDSAFTQISYRDPYDITLKKGRFFDTLQQRSLPPFTYLDSSNVDLQRVRKAFRLDSVAGRGNEVSRLLNLLHFVHNAVWHDGGSDNPVMKNAIDLVQVCRTEHRGVNCRMMATILNECCLSMGYRSRMVTCMPRPLEFQDCHVINEVWSVELKKWIWLDPTFDAYVMDEKGVLLGIGEVRERLIDGRPLILNPEANWNRQQSETRENYLESYMTKNLYRIETHANSTCNAETAAKGKVIEYIQLLPLDGLNNQPPVTSTTNEKTGVTHRTWVTNNPKLFWSAPTY
jgi:hypothetical protein